MKINIKNIGQLDNFSFETTRRVTIIHAENGTGKSTFSRLLASINNNDHLDHLKPYCNFDHQASVEIGNSTLRFKNTTWSRPTNNFYIFNGDYYAQSIISKLGDKVYIGNYKSNSVRRYLECWKIIDLVNRAHSQKNLFKLLLSSFKIINFIHLQSFAPLFSWYQKCLQYDDINRCDQNAFYKDAEKTLNHLRKGLPHHQINAIKLINFVRNVVNKFPANYSELSLSRYEEAMFSTHRNRLNIPDIEPWKFWKLAFIYTLKHFLDEQYDILPVSIRNKYDLLDDFENVDMIKNVAAHIDETQISDDVINDLLQAIGLGFKYKVVNHEIRHRFYNNGKIHQISSAENRLLSLCFFLSQISKHITNSPDNYIIIDDPINSMDSNYSLNIVRLISNLVTSSRFGNINWIILTHNAHFCDQLIFRLHRDDMRHNTTMAGWYLNSHLRTRVKYYHRQFNTIMKRVISDILTMSQNPEDYNLIDLCNKIRTLLEIYCTVYAGNLNFNLLFEDRDCFSTEEKTGFQSVIDILNRYSHGGVDFVTDTEPLTGSMNKMLTFAVKLIKVYSPKIWESL